MYVVYIAVFIILGNAFGNKTYCTEHSAFLGTAKVGDVIVFLGEVGSCEMRVNDTKHHVMRYTADQYFCLDLAYQSFAMTSLRQIE